MRVRKTSILAVSGVVLWNVSFWAGAQEHFFNIDSEACSKRLDGVDLYSAVDLSALINYNKRTQYFRFTFRESDVRAFSDLNSGIGSPKILLWKKWESCVERELLGNGIGHLLSSERKSELNCVSRVAWNRKLKNHNFKIFLLNLIFFFRL